MKHLLLLFLFIGGSLATSQAQSFVFLNNGVPVEDNATVLCGNIPLTFHKAPITIQKVGNENVEAKLTLTVSSDSYGGVIGYCGWGLENCITIDPGNSLLSAKTVTNNDAIDPDIETMPMGGFSFLFNVEYKLTYGSTEQKIDVVLSSGPLSIKDIGDGNPAVSVVSKDGKTFLKYAFAGNEKRQIRIFDLLGRKVSEITLLQAEGTLPLSDLGKGIYLYSLTVNGKTEAAEKFIIQ